MACWLWPGFPSSPSSCSFTPSFTSTLILHPFLCFLPVWSWFIKLSASRTVPALSVFSHYLTHFYFPASLPPSQFLPSSSPLHLMLNGIFRFLKLPGNISSHQISFMICARLPVSHRSRPWNGDSAGVASPPLGRLPVLLIGSLKHLLHITDLVLADRRHVHVTPETWQQQAGGLAMCGGKNRETD